MGDMMDDSLGPDDFVRNRQHTRTLPGNRDSQQYSSVLEHDHQRRGSFFDNTEVDIRRNGSGFRDWESDSNGNFRRVEPVFKGFVLKPKSMNKAKTSDWTIATKHEMLSSQRDLEAEVKSRRNAKKSNVNSEFAKLSTKQQEVLTRLVESLMDKEENEYAKWLLAVVKPDYDLLWGKPIDTKSIQVILKRQDRDDDKLSEAEPYGQSGKSRDRNRNRDREMSFRRGNEIDISMPRNSDIRSHDWRVGSLGDPLRPSGEDRFQKDLNDLNEWRVDVNGNGQNFAQNDYFGSSPRKSRQDLRRSKSGRNKSSIDPLDYIQNNNPISPGEGLEDPLQGNLHNQQWHDTERNEFPLDTFPPAQASIGKKNCKKSKKKGNSGTNHNTSAGDIFAGLDLPSKDFGPLDNPMSKYQNNGMENQSHFEGPNPVPSHQPNEDAWPGDFDNSKSHVSQNYHQPQQHSQYSAGPQLQHNPSFADAQFHESHPQQSLNMTRPQAPESTSFNVGARALQMPDPRHDNGWNGNNGSNNNMFSDGFPSRNPLYGQTDGFGAAPNSYPPPTLMDTTCASNGGMHNPPEPNPFEPLPHVPMSARYLDDTLNDYRSTRRPGRRNSSHSREKSSHHRRRSSSRDRSSSREHDRRSRRSSGGQKDLKRVENKIDELADKLERMHSTSEPSEPRSEGTSIFSDPLADRAFTPPSTPPKSPMIGRGSLYAKDSGKRYIRSGYRGRHGRAGSVELIPARSVRDRQDDSLESELHYRYGSKGSRPILEQRAGSYDDYPRVYGDDRHSPEFVQYRPQRRLTSYEDREYDPDHIEARLQQEAAQHIHNRRRLTIEPAIEQPYLIRRRSERRPAAYGMSYWD